MPNSFVFSIGSLYTAPALSVVTRLTTEASAGARRTGRGERLGPDGSLVLTGVARVPVVPVQSTMDYIFR